MFAGTILTMVTPGCRTVLSINRGIKLLLVVVAISVVPCVSFSQDTTKVLFIGNSFMSFNDLPALFSQFAQGSGEHVVVASHIPGGASVGDTIQGTFAHMNNPYVYSLIKSNDWDYLFLQDRQSRFAMSRGVFPGDSKVIEGHVRLRDSLLYHHPCAHMIWFAGFGPKNGYPPLAATGAGLIDSIYQNYQFLDDSAGQIMAPIGPAWLRIMSEYPSIDLWRPDEEHPSLKGSLLIASVLYSTIFKRSPIGSSFNPGVPYIEDSILKSTGYYASIDSIEFTGLSGITPTIIQTGNSLSVNGFNSCSWYYNSVSFAANNCIAAITQSGNYFALVEDGHGCIFRTLEQPYFLTTGTNEQDREHDFYAVFPNPGSSAIRINSEMELHAIRIFNSLGKLMHEISDPAKQTETDISSWPKGLYIILVIPKQGLTGIKWFIRI